MFVGEWRDARNAVRINLMHIFNLIARLFTVSLSSLFLHLLNRDHEAPNALKRPFILQHIESTEVAQRLSSACILSPLLLSSWINFIRKIDEDLCANSSCVFLSFFFSLQNNGLQAVSRSDSGSSYISQVFVLRSIKRIYSIGLCANPGSSPLAHLIHTTRFIFLFFRFGNENYFIMRTSTLA